MMGLKTEEIQTWIPHFLTWLEDSRLGKLTLGGVKSRVESDVLVDTTRIPHLTHQRKNI